MTIPPPRARAGALLAPPDTAAALPLFAVPTEALDGFLAGRGAGVACFLRAGGFAAAPGQLALIPGPDGLAGAAVGLGPEGGAAARSPWSFGDLPRRLPDNTDWRLEGAPDRDAAVLGWCLGAYGFHRHRAPRRAPARLLGEPDEAGAALASAIHWARDLINTPAADLGPAELIAAMADMAAEAGASIEVVEGESLRREFPAVWSVGQASHRAPLVGVLRWQAPGGDPAAPLVALCGKGVCFDTGGLDLKPPAAMLRMKKDMGGAAVVMGLAAAIMRARLPVRLLVLVGAVENAVSERAMRPGDVLATRAGVSVEVGNTDAEGRLVLADLLCRAGEERPALLVDCATLTGAARVALGPDLPALFTPDDALAANLAGAGARVADPLWRLPLHDDYVSWLDSAVADMNNVSSKPMAGSIVAALFLRRFVPAGTPWAHLDLYAWNDASRPGRPEGGEAQALRALLAGIATLFGSGTPGNAASGATATGAGTTGIEVAEAGTAGPE